MGGACGTNGAEEKCYRLGGEKLKGRENVEDLGVVGV
jgi:hypothetical protein